MAQGRLVGLGMLSIENDVASCLDYSDVSAKFAAVNARKVRYDCVLTDISRMD